MNKLKALPKLEEMEYCYCRHCQRLRVSEELVLTSEGLQCRHCGYDEFDEPGWISCPYHKMTAVKCPRAGKGIIHNGSGLDCSDRCFFRS